MVGPPLKMTQLRLCLCTSIDAVGVQYPASIIKDRHKDFDNTILFVETFQYSDFYFTFVSHRIESIGSLKVFLRTDFFHVPLVAVLP